MKKLLLSLIALALITSSCYKKDFKNLNTRIDALAAQIQGVNALVAGIQASQLTLAQLTAATAGIAPIQAGLTALTATVNGIQTTLATVAAGTLSNTAALAALNTLVTNNQTAALAAIATLNTNLTAAITAAQNNINAATVAAINAQTAVLTAAITAAQNNINAATAAAVTAAQTALTALINANLAAIQANGAAIAALSTQLANAVITLNNSIAAAQANIIADNLNQTTLLTGLINALSIQLAIANANIAALLSSNDIFLGDLHIFDETSLAFAEGLGVKVKAINGNVWIQTAGLDAGQMTRLRQVTNGSQPSPSTVYFQHVTGDFTIDGDKSVNAAKLLHVGGDVNLSGAGDDLSGLITVIGNVDLLDNTHDVSSLISVTGYYFADANPVDDALQSVGSWMTVNYPGGYDYPNLLTVVGLLTANANGNGFPSTINIINFPKVSSGTVFNDGSSTDVVQWDWAASVNIGGSTSLQELRAHRATSVILGETTYTNGHLYIHTAHASFGGPQNPSAIDLSKMVSVNGPIEIWQVNSASSTVDFSNFTGNGSNTINMEGLRNLVMPKYAGTDPAQLLISDGSLGSGGGPSILTAVLANYQGPTNLDGMSILENLTVGNLKQRLGDASGALISNTLENLTVTGTSYKAYTYPAVIPDYNVDMSGFTNLETISTSGILSSLRLAGNTSLTSVTTAGQMDFVQVTGASVLTNLTFGHNVALVPSSTGTVVQVTGNASLTSLTTGTISYMRELTVTGNGLLTAVNFSSYQVGQTINSGPVIVHVNSNRLGGSYVQSIFALNAPPIMTQAGLSTLKAYVQGLYANVLLTVDLSLGYRTTGVVGVDNIAATLDADEVAFVGAGGLAVNSFVQRSTDAEGALGTRISNARELSYLQ